MVKKRRLGVELTWNIPGDIPLMTATQIIKLLAEEYGNREWHSHHDPLSELMVTILSQNTSDANSGRAFSSLMDAFRNWDEIAEAEVGDIEWAIRSGGLSQIKATRIKSILHTILDERGCLDLAFLDSMELSEAKSWLRKLPGVGPKTVGCVLLFSLGKPVFPVDTHVYRITKRLGLISARVSVEEAHDLLEAMVPPENVYSFHMNLVEHGRRVCKSQRPRCFVCTLRSVCPSQMLES